MYIYKIVNNRIVIIKLLVFVLISSHQQGVKCTMCVFSSYFLSVLIKCILQLFLIEKVDESFLYRFYTTNFSHDIFSQFVSNFFMLSTKGWNALNYLQ